MLGAKFNKSLYLNSRNYLAINNNFAILEYLPLSSYKSEAYAHCKDKVILKASIY